MNEVRSRSAQQDGFTLVELMVVVLIIGILIAIAIPTFMGARERTYDKAAQTSLRTALVVAKTLYTDDATYDAATPANLNAAEPSITFVDGATDSTGAEVVSVIGAGDDFYASAMSNSGTVFAMWDNATSGLQYAYGDLSSTPFAAAGPTMLPGGMMATMDIEDEGCDENCIRAEGDGPYSGYTSAMFFAARGNWAGSWDGAADSYGAGHMSTV